MVVDLYQEAQPARAFSIEKAVWRVYCREGWKPVATFDRYLEARNYCRACGYRIGSVRSDLQVS